MVDAKQALLDDYSNLISIFEQQIEIASQNRYDEQLRELEELESKKHEYKQRIDQRLSVQPLTSFDDVNREIIGSIERLQQLNDQLYAIIQSWYQEDTKSLRQVSLQRKTIQTYGNLRDSDIISYYFDKRQ